jgi:nitroreductase
MPSAADPHDTIRPLLRTRQVRDFTDEPVDPAALDALADAARWSGSSQNTQPWRFVLVRERGTLDRLAEVGAPHTRSLGTAAAAIAIVLPAAPGSAVSHAFDEGRAAERILVAASLLGLAAGIGWVRSEVRPAIGDLLGLPEDRFVRTIVAVGHPTPQARQPKKPRGEARLPRRETVFEERWPAEG